MTLAILTMTTNTALQAQTRSLSVENNLQRMRLMASEILMLLNKNTWNLLMRNSCKYTLHHYIINVSISE